MASTTKMRAPAGFGGLKIAGRDIEVSDDGSHEAHQLDVATLRSHGFQDWHDQPGASGDVETMTKEQLVEMAVNRTRDEAGKLDIEELRRHMMRATGKTPAPPAAEPKSEAEVSGMSRKDLFAYLKENGVAIGTATGDENLRTAALETFRKQAA